MLIDIAFLHIIGFWIDYFFVFSLQFKPKSNIMSIKKTLVLLFLGLSSISQVALAQLNLPNFFSDHMVLQRDTKINFWGWGHAGSTIKITGTWFTDTVSSKVNSDGQWQVKLPDGKAGGPHEILIQAGPENITLKDVLLGDVFLCSGQSNMEWSGNQNLQEIIDELPNLNNDAIRLLQVSHIGADHPQDQIPSSWSTLNAETLKPFSAIGYFIAKNINKEENVPVGVINSSWGGTPAETWTAKYLIENDVLLKQYAAAQVFNDYRPHLAGNAWNAMIYPLIGYNLKSVFWYQGESNVGTWPGYNKLMKTMINSWRSAWNHDFPFYFVQIAPFSYNNPTNSAAFLREQQTKTSLELSKTGMAVITDLVDDITNIHPSQKIEVAKRLSDMVLAEVYNHDIKDYKSPYYKTHTRVKNTIEITFDNLADKLQSTGEITDLYIASSDKKFHPAQGKIQGNKLIVWASNVKDPIAVRFGFTETAMPNLFNSRGLPVNPFRTDDWDDIFIN